MGLLMKFNSNITIHRCATDKRVFDGFRAISSGRVRASFRGVQFAAQDRVDLNCDVDICLKQCPLVGYDSNKTNMGVNVVYF
jgi:hypothetical protein